jgi:hypothetical protein
MKMPVKRLFVLSLLLLLISAAAAAAQRQVAAPKDESLRMGETRATLDPGKFNDPRIKEAYRVAKEIPWVLDSLYCYCMCKESPTFRHKSLLSCYVDDHAAM